jgi:hypothetical protein
MNRDCAQIVSDATLLKRAFKYDSSPADIRFFKQKIVEFLKSSTGKSFTQFMYEAVWERNDAGKTLKYCDFNERQQKVFLDPYFYEWMKRTIKKAETELLMISEMISVMNDERIATQRASNQGGNAGINK